MASNKENRSPAPKTEGEKHQGVGVNTPAKTASEPQPREDGDETKR